MNEKELRRVIREELTSLEEEDYEEIENPNLEPRVAQGTNMQIEGKK